MNTVLIVDDHALVRGGLVALLSVAPDLEVVGEAEDADTAVLLAAERVPDLVVMDLSLAGSDGVDATARIRAADPDVRILVLTSFADQRWVRGALDAGADGYLLKHSEPEEILAGVREVLAGGSPLDPRAARVVIRRPEPAAPELLTPREEEVLQMVVSGQSNKEIARSLGIAERTVKAHLTQVFVRLGVRDRTQAALWVMRRDLERRETGS